MRLQEALRNKKLNKRGAAIAMVIVAMAFIGILAALIMFMAYMNYYMKITNMRSTDNFYSAEGVVEQMKTGLQEEMSEAVGEAYAGVLERYADYTEAERQNYFDLQVVSKLRTLVKGDDDAKVNYSLGNLCGFVNCNNDYSYDTTSDEEHCTFTVTDEAGDNVDVTVYGAKTNSMVVSSNGIVLKNVKVEFVDKRGYTSIIETDFRMNAPVLDFSDPQESSELLEYAIIADKHLECDGITQLQEGNVYAGSGIDTDATISGNSLIMGLNSELTVLSSDKFVVGDTVQVKQTGKLVTKEDVNFWTKSFSLEGVGAELDLDGINYVADDLEFNKNGGKASLKGTYYGYGIDTNFTTDSTGSTYGDDSSAILINAKNSDLDLSQTQTLWLGGRSYVGTKRIASTGSSSNVNIPMSESISVRGNQIAYLVPAKALAQMNGSSLVTRNPMTSEEYVKYIESNQGSTGFVECNLGYVPDGMSALSNYTTGKGYQTVWAQGLGNSTSIVYYYLLMDASGANRYFQDYYGIAGNKEQINDYLQAYIGGNAIKTNTDADATISIAGNWLAYDGTADADNPTISLKEAAGTSEFTADATTYAGIFEALNTKLTDNPSKCTTEEKEKHSVYANIINTDKVSGIGTMKFTDDAGNTAVVTSAATYPAAATDRVIVCAGDITITGDFEGIAIAGGKITINGSGTIKNDLNDQAIIKDLMGREESTGAYHLYDFFKEGSSLAGSTTTNNTDDEDNSLSKLVTYENWYKE